MPLQMFGGGERSYILPQGLEKGLDKDHLDPSLLLLLPQ